MGYYFSKVLPCSYKEAILRVKEALKTEGFGVLTEIDVKATLRKKLGVDFRDYCILGACNPSFAHRALDTERHVGLLLPCNVVVQATDEGMAEVSVIETIYVRFNRLHRCSSRSCRQIKPRAHSPQ